MCVCVYVHVQFELIVLVHSLNEPRYASLPNIMKAKKKPLIKLTPEDLGIDISPRIETLKVEEPAKRVGGRKVDSVDDLIDKLRNEAKVL